MPVGRDGLGWDELGWDLSSWIDLYFWLRQINLNYANCRIDESFIDLSNQIKYETLQIKWFDFTKVVRTNQIIWSENLASNQFIRFEWLIKNIRTTVT